MMAYGMARLRRDSGISPPKSHCSSQVKWAWPGRSGSGLTNGRGGARSRDPARAVIGYLTSMQVGCCHARTNCAVGGRAGRWAEQPPATQVPQLSLSADTRKVKSRWETRGRWPAVTWYVIMNSELGSGRVTICRPGILFSAKKIFVVFFLCFMFKSNLRKTKLSKA